MKQHSLFLPIVSIVCISIPYLLIFILNDKQILSYAKEDGIFETGTAFIFLLASIIFFLLFNNDKQGNDLFYVTFKKNMFFLLLALLFFFAFGEEISWGQRIINIETPDAIKKVNIQDEFTIHNLTIFDGKGEDGEFKSGLARLFTAAGLFSVFWFSYCLVLPIINKISTISHLVKTINIPTPPIWIGFLFLLNFLIFEIHEAGLSGKVLRAVCEIKEFNFSFLFLMLGLWFLIKNQTNNGIRESDHH